MSSLRAISFIFDSKGQSSILCASIHVSEIIFIHHWTPSSEHRYLRVSSALRSWLDTAGPRFPLHHLLHGSRCRSIEVFLWPFCSPSQNKETEPLLLNSHTQSPSSIWYSEISCSPVAPTKLRPILLLVSNLLSCCATLGKLILIIDV